MDAPPHYGNKTDFLSAGRQGRSYRLESCIIASSISLRKNKLGKWPGRFNLLWVEYASRPPLRASADALDPTGKTRKQQCSTPAFVAQL